MKIKFEAELEEAIQFEVEVKETELTYAEHLLVIINNAREYPKEFLEWHGKILAQRRVLVCRPEYIHTKQSAEYLDNVFESDDEPYEIVTLAPEDLF